MTVISHSIDPPFFVAGDVLMSIKGKKIPFVPPTMPIDISQVLNEKNRVWYPYELRRKVYILKQNLVVAFSGDGYEITEFLKELRIKCNYYDDGSGKIKIEGVMQILSGYDFKNLFKKSSFFMMHINDDELKATPISWGQWDAVDNETYHKMFANGSGADGYLYWLNEKIVTTSSHPEGDVNRLVQMNCAFIGKLLAIERYSHFTLRDNWGAGFELIFHTGKSFIKLEEIAYVLFEAKFDSDGDIGLPYPSCIMYYKYHGEVLVITSIEVFHAKPEEVGSDFIALCYDIEARVYPVLPLDVNDADIDKNAYTKDASFITHSVARAYALNQDGYIHSVPSGFNFGPEISVEYKQNENVAKIRMDKFLLQEMKNKAKDLFLKL
jgi:hypothetical protein